jgi:nitric oxide reductase NorQ protein
MGGECRDSVVVYAEIEENKKRELAAREWSAGAPFLRPPFPHHLETTMTTPPPPAPGPAPAPRITPTGRLGQGELRRQVAGCLAADPAAGFTPGSVARALGKSAGATGNALATLAGRGEAERLPGSPVRYRATADTARAAAAPPPAAARPRKPAAPAAPVSPAPAPAPAPPGPAAAPPAPGPLTRPGGQVYRPRTLADMADVTALRALREAGIPALLYGPPGTGKTSLAEAAFPDLITIAGDGDTTVADFTGDYTQRPDGTYEFIYGPLIQAMTEGRALLIDDATLISPQVLAVAYPAMDGRREITVKACKGQTIKAAPGFYVIGGHNPGVHGAVLTEALASRFAVQIQVATDYDLARSLKIEPRAITVARTLARRQAAGEIGWAPQLRELIAFDKITRVLGLDAAVANLAGIAPEEDRDVVTETAAKAFGRPVAPLALGRQI